MVATTDGRPPPSFTAYCVRSDLFSMTTEPPYINVNVTAPTDDLYGSPTSTVSLCVYDHALQTLQWRSTSRPIHSCPVLDLSSTIPATRIEGPKVLPFSVHVNVSSMCIRMRDILRVPVLEVETSQVMSECEMQSTGRLTGNASCSPEIWSYNARLKVWEPVMAPVAVQVCRLCASTITINPSIFSYHLMFLHTCLLLQVQFSHDSGTPPHIEFGGESGTSITMSISSQLHLTCSHAALDSILRALAWWRNAATSSDSGSLHRHAAAADNAVVLTEVHNAVGEPLKMWMDFGDRTHVAELAKGVQRLMQPLVRPVPRVLSMAATDEAHRPTMLLSVTLDSFHHLVRYLGLHTYLLLPRDCCLNHMPMQNAQSRLCRQTTPRQMSRKKAFSLWHSPRQLQAAVWHAWWLMGPRR